MRGYENGLIDASVPEEVQLSIDREKFVAEWIATNPDLVLWLRKKSKDELITLLLEQWIGFIPENAKLHPEIRAGQLFMESQAYQAYLRGLAQSFKNGTDVGTRNAIEAWFKEAKDTAGSNVELIAALGVVQGRALDRITTAKYMAFKKKAPDGRKKGASTNKQKADDHLDKLRSATLDYLKSPASSGKDDGDVADFLMQRNLHRHPNGKYTRRTLMSRVKRLRAEYVCAFRGT